MVDKGHFITEGHSRNGTAQTWNLIIPLEADFSMLDSE